MMMEELLEIDARRRASVADGTKRSRLVATMLRLSVPVPLSYAQIQVLASELLGVEVDRGYITCLANKMRRHGETVPERPIHSSTAVDAKKYRALRSDNKKLQAVRPLLKKDNPALSYRDVTEALHVQGIEVSIGYVRFMAHTLRNAGEDLPLRPRGDKRSLPPDAR